MKNIKSLFILSILLFPASLFSSEMQAFYHVKKKKFIDFNEVSSLISASDVIYVGEIHDKAACHQAQLKALSILSDAKKGKVAVGFEMLNSSLQQVLDEFSSGFIEENAFLEKVNWKKEWGFDYSLYKPIFDFIRENKLHAVALNVPRKIVSKTARGGLSALDSEDKQFLPSKIKVNKNKEYVNYLKESFGGHGDNPMAKIMTFDNYMLSMAVWNESMADKAALFLKSRMDWGFLVIAGNGHVMYNAAIPWSLKRRVKSLKHLSFYTEDISKKDEYLKDKKPLADIIWFVDFSEK